MPNRILIHSALFFVALIYGANYSIAKFAMPTYVEPLGFVALRVLIGGMIFWVLHHFVSSEKVERKDYFLLVVCGLFGVALNQMAFLYGLNLTSPINASILMTVTPIMVFMAAFFMGREQVSFLKISGLVIGAIGAYLLITKDGASLQSQSFIGDIFIILNALFYAIYLVLVRGLMRKYKALTVIKWVFLFGGILAIPFGWNDLMAVEWFDLPDKIVFALIYMVIGTTVIAYLLNVWTLTHVESSVVGAYIYLQPVLAIIVAVALKEDNFDWLEGLYSVIIMTGVYLVSKKNKIKGAES